MSIVKNIDVGASCSNCHFGLKCMYRLLFANDFWHVLGSRSFVYGLLIDTRVVALLGLTRFENGAVSVKQKCSAFAFG